MENTNASVIFSNRLNALQKLCSDSDPIYPKALLFVAGQDGRYNKGSITFLKYLFRGCVSKELFDETLESKFESLEDLVVLIKRTSVSIILSNEMRNLLGPVYNTIPFLVEYLSTEEEEKEIDSMQARKCCDFKRMMLESVKEGEGVGIPVPIGYDDIQDIENWPLLQSFAMDQVYCPTGFFTSRYTVADISEHLEILFKTVDNSCVDRAISTIHKTIRPYMLQTISMLDATTAEQRSSVTREDVMGPLEVLYEFGELDVAGVLDPSTRPVVLFGAETASFAVAPTQSDPKWQLMTVGTSSHVIFEACEPGTGLRWCRTYFLRRGRSVDLISDADAIVKDDDDDENDSSDESSNHQHHSSSHHPHHHHATCSPEEVEALHRLEGLYVKLWVCLRSVVRTAFANHSDVLEAGTYVQQRMDLLLTGNNDTRDPLTPIDDDANVVLRELVLLPTERLQVHMDCMNATGEIVAIEDVDDMGGACWTYIRVSVYGISLGVKGQVGTVAVGDTFLFSSNATVSRIDDTYAVDISGSNRIRLPLIGDAYCITHSLPYYRCLIGGGSEEKAAQRLIACSKSPAKLALLGLGKAINYPGSGTITLPLLTDHWAVPIVEAELRIFSEGFLVDRMDGINTSPFLLSIGKHVERMWVVDSTECMDQARRLLSSQKNLSDIPTTELPSGLLIVFRLRTSADEIVTSEPAVFSSNQLQYVTPFMAPNLSDMSSSSEEAAHHVALFVRTGSRAVTAMTAASAAWKVACRIHDVQEYRGGDVALPVDILRAFLTAIDFWSNSPLKGSEDSDSAASDDLVELTSSSIVSVGEFLIQNSSLILPGLGLNAVRCVHTLSEARRLSQEDPNVFDELRVNTSLSSKAVLSAKKEIAKRQIIVVAGHAGSGITCVSTNLLAQLSDQFKSQTSSVFVDFADFAANQEEPAEQQFSRFLQKELTTATHSAVNSKLLLVVLTMSATTICRFPELLSFVSTNLSGRIVAVLSVVAPSSLWGQTKQSYATTTLNESLYGLGQESWRATVGQILAPTCCDFIVAVDDTVGGSSDYASLRSHLSETNPTAVVVRLSPNHLRLDEETVGLVLDTIHNNTASRTRNTYRALAGYSSDYVAYMVNKQGDVNISLHTTLSYTPKFVGSGLRIVRLTTLKNAEWNLNNIIKLFQLLVPKGKVCTTVIEDTWNVPTSSSSSSVFTRLVELAKAKVLAMRQCEESKKRFAIMSKELLKGKEKQLACIVSGLRSIHGTVRTRAGLVLSNSESTSYRSQQQNSAVVEVCKGFVVLRPSALSSSDKKHSNLVIQGIFSNNDVILITELFDLCHQLTLPRKKHVSTGDLTSEEKLRIQALSKFSTRPLPGDVWFDGYTYVDINGTRSVLRPDIDGILQEHVEDENKRTDGYNAMLSIY